MIITPDLPTHIINILVLVMYVHVEYILHSSNHLNLVICSHMTVKQINQMIIYAITKFTHFKRNQKKETKKQKKNKIKYQFALL